MQGRWLQIGVGATAVVLHIGLLAVLPSIDDGQPRSCPVMVHLEARAVEPKPAMPAPVIPPQLIPQPVIPVKPQQVKTPPVPVRTAAVPPVPVKPMPAAPQPAAAPAPTTAPVPAAPPGINPGRLAGIGATGSGPVAPSGSSEPTPAGPVPATPGPSTGDGKGDAPAIDTGKVLADYSGGVSSRIRQHQHYPSSEQQAGHEGKVKVSFTLAADGHLVDVSVASSSGFSELDAAAQAAVKSAAPFAPIPAELKRSSARLSITLRFFLQ